MTLLFKIALVLLLLFVIVNLGFALFQMVREPQESTSTKPMSFYLGRRLVISTAIIILLISALLLGWIEPNPRPY
ncbi:DUF2909 family protein [Vibrio mexicanus]|uniref:DUF2909 family protein n=1 Tax=Vibrio mexicanus TaxID=1004326 RepID=UPI00063CC9F3|nr:DUF2909 family protein [Vibrio mexicanus]